MFTNGMVPIRDIKAEFGTDALGMVLLSRSVIFKNESRYWAIISNPLPSASTCFVYKIDEPMVKAWETYFGRTLFPDPVSIHAVVGDKFLQSLQTLDWLKPENFSSCRKSDQDPHKPSPQELRLFETFVTLIATLFDDERRPASWETHAELHRREDERRATA